MKTGIYKITNTVNQHSYIGCSNNIDRRWSEHRNVPFQSERSDDLKKPLYKAIRKYGLQNFKFEILELCAIEELESREIFYIEQYGTYKNREHYNTTPGGCLRNPEDALRGEAHGMAILSHADVVEARLAYAKGISSRAHFENSKYKDEISWSGFLRMWHGQNWQHVMPEVFIENPRKGSYSESDMLFEVEKFLKSGMKLHAYVKTDACLVGYGTLYKMINNPDFYKGK